MRAQVLGTVLGINAVAALAAGWVVVLNARTATEREMQASAEIAEQLVRETAERVADEQGRVTLAGLPVQLRFLRHVRIRVEGADGAVAALPGAQPGRAEDDGAPAWFRRLVGVSEVVRRIEIAAQGAPAGRVIVTGVPDDELAEVWDDVTDFAVISVAVNGAVLLALFLALGRVRRELKGLQGALEDLEQGRFDCRMAPPRTREVAVLAERFNALAQALGAAHEDNIRLGGRLVSVQEDERRQIAGELHDELGPCMFGLKANAESLQRLAAEAPDSLAARMRPRIAALVGIVERMQALNRQMLRRIRPAALDHIPLADVLANLVADFRQHDPGRSFVLDVGRLAPGYGPARDATLYRCVQEAVTNALTHGDARRIRIGLHEVAAPRGAVVLCLRVEDDGRGLPQSVSEGLGLTGMSERVRALGGTCVLAAGPEGGACVAVELPVAAGADERERRRP